MAVNRARGHRLVSGLQPLFVMALAAAVAAGVAGCSGPSQTRSELIKALQDTSSDLSKAQLALNQVDGGRTLSTTAQVDLKYARKDTTGTLKKVVSIKPGTPQLRRDQHQVQSVISGSVAAMIQADAAISTPGLRGRARRSLTTSVRSVGRVEHRLERHR